MRSETEQRAGLARPPRRRRDVLALAELFVEGFRRDLAAFSPQYSLVVDEDRPEPEPNFRVVVEEDGDIAVSLFGARHRVATRSGGRASPRDIELIRAVGAVLELRYHHLFRVAHASRLDLFRGNSEDHYVAAFIEPDAFVLGAGWSSRIASTIQTLRTAALSTYENRRVSTGALLDGPAPAARPTPADALTYGPELAALKSLHRLCDGTRTLFRVDRRGKLAEIVDIHRRAAEVPDCGPAGVPCARMYAAHARATRSGGEVCLVLSPNQEIKLFAGGEQAFAFAHGRWRLLDPAAKFAAWETALARPALARSTFQAALDLAECRQGGLFVVLDDPDQAVGRLVAPADRLGSGGHDASDPAEPPDKRALHYLARGRDVDTLDPTVLEALAAIDGALVLDRSGRLVAFGAILRHDPARLAFDRPVEGARTTAALAASRFGSVLKVSEDGIVSCFLAGARAWDL